MQKPLILLAPATRFIQQLPFSNFSSFGTVRSVVRPLAPAIISSTYGGYLQRSPFLFCARIVQRGSRFLKNRVIDCNVVLQLVDRDCETERFESKAHFMRDLYSIDIFIVI